MAMYNSSAGSNQDDTDATMINHSFLYGQNDEPISTCLPILRRAQQANQPSKPIHKHTNSNGQHDYIFVDHDPSGASKQIEQILEYYRNELKQESFTQLDCSRQLMTRLVDFIRPVYSSNQMKMKDLDGLFEDISVLHERRFVDEKGKTERLQSEVRDLKKSIVLTPMEDGCRNSIMTSLCRMNSIVDYEQWMEIEEETKKLHRIVETQRDRINELIELLSQEGTHKSNNDSPPREKTRRNKHQSSAPEANFESTFVTKVPLLDRQPESSTDALQTSTNETHSPRTSSVHVSTTILPDSSNGTVENKPEIEGRYPDGNIHRQLLSRISSCNCIEKCTVCDYKFPIPLDDREIIDHLEKCSPPLNSVASKPFVEPEQYECSNCRQKLPSVTDESYEQHLSACYYSESTVSF